ncbi:unnamed protein product [Anisakis simplex]|uniref:Ig-like domain-containing protein n=1 Tax=Anisakis simplex TaxID=6269 RepID=A0A0M3J673_ANISI|nr:unnamed protein product [Anisakis simplex]
MTAYLHCLTQNTNPTIQWMRGNSVIRNTDRTRLFQNGTLMIPKVTLQDGGAYRCRVQTAGGTTEATLHLKILELPRAAVYPTSLFFVRGQSFNISCHVTGQTAILSLGNLIKPDHRKYYITYKYDLIVHRPFELDAGVYECRAHNQAGYHVDSAVAQMAIKPKVKVTRDRQMIGRGDRVTLECQASLS